MKPSSLRCEYVVNPIGLDVLQPRLSWMLPPGKRRGICQSAYRILVASSPELLAKGQGDLWDSGRTKSDASIHVQYAGKTLESRTCCYWKVQIWDESDAASDWSDVATWEMGLLKKSDWQAKWIASSLVGGVRTTIPSPYLRREFKLDRKVRSARLYATALGLYEFYLNGHVVSKDVFRPGWTDYHKRVQYNVYDVTALLKKGENAAGAILGDGWYSGHVGWYYRQVYGDRPKLLAQLVVEFDDGSTQTILTDESWKTSPGPILEADMLMGESYDARLEMPDWSKAGFDDAEWSKVKVIADPGIERVPQYGPPVRRIQEIKAEKVGKDASSWIVTGGGIYDMHQNMVGRVRLRMRGPRGAVIDIRHAEVLDKNGKIYTENLRSARALDSYTLSGNGEETWEPRFTFHGFRYVDISFRAKIELLEVTGVVLHSDTPPTGDFECSDPLINQLQHNIQWGQRGNFLEVPTDCPQRDERLGWMGDAQVFIRTAAFNMDVSRFFTKWQTDLDDAQGKDGSMPPVVPAPSAIGLPPVGGPAWEDAAVICPWTIHLCYGDTRLLEQHYESLNRFVNFLTKTSRDGVRCYDANEFRGFGDWLALDGSGTLFGGTSYSLIGTAFYAYSTRLLGRIAKALGKDAEATRLEKQFEKIRKAFNREFVTPAGRISGGTQTSYVLALHFDLLPEHLRAAAVEELVSDIKSRGMHLSTGFVGTSYLPHVLSRNGRIDIAYELLHQKTWPSWLYAVTQGATTIWERWDGWTHDKGFQDVGMNSFNHYAYGAIGEWLYSTVAGLDIDPVAPAYKHAIIKPQPGGGLTHASASLETLFGKLSSGWKIEGKKLTLEVVVPPNTTATVYVPSKKDEPVKEGSALATKAPGIKALGWENGAAVYQVGSGTYKFSARWE